MTDNNLIRKKEHNRNVMLNFLKGIGCIGVVFIHIPFPGITGIMLANIATFAVPVFFMISGFYAYDANYSNVKIKRRMLKIVKILICAIILYFFFTIALHLINENIGEWFSKLLSIKVVFKFIVLNDLDIISGGLLWFLPALIYSYLILMFVNRYRLIEIVYKMLPVLFAIKILVGIVCAYRNMSWHYTANFLVGGVPFFFMGHYIAANGKTAKINLKDKQLICLGIVAISVICVNCAIDRRGVFTVIGTVVLSISLFMFAIKNPQKTISSTIENLGDKYSLYVYILHVIIGNVLNICNDIAAIPKNIYLWVKPVLSVVLSILVSVLIYKFNEIYAKQKMKNINSNK